MRGAARLTTATLLAGAMGLATPAWGQSASNEQRQPTMQEQQAGTGAAEPGTAYRWNVSISGGNISGATSVGAVENLFFITGFETGSGTLFSGRAAYRAWWRLGGEVELGAASPGVDAVLTDLNGAQRTQFDFADYAMTYVSFSLRLDLVDAFATPFLVAGPAFVFGDTEGESNTEAGFLFGGGIDVKVYGPVIVRFDVKGLRSKVDAVGLTRGRLVTEGAIEDPPLSTQVLWTIGIGVRF